VIGVSKDAKYASVEEKPSPSVVRGLCAGFRSAVRSHFRGSLRATCGSPGPAVRAAIGGINSGISLEFRNFETQVDESLLQPGMVALLSSFFGGLALLLAMIGLYGVTAYGVARRQGEIGIRMALGAQPGAVIWLVLREVVLMLALGTVLGLAASLAAGRLVASLLYGVRSYDLAPLAAGTVVLGAATGVAAYLPARRAARLDPATALARGVTAVTRRAARTPRYGHRGPGRRSLLRHRRSCAPARPPGRPPSPGWTSSRPSTSAYRNVGPWRNRWRHLLIREILRYAGVALIHQLDAVFLQDGKSRLVPVGHLRGFFESQAFHPEPDARLDFFHRQYRRQFFHHRKSSLTGMLV